MSWVIRYFSKEDESYAGEQRLLDVTLKSLQENFGVSSDNPMYDSYPIEGERIKYFEKILRVEFDFDKYDYFLEFDG